MIYEHQSTKAHNAIQYNLLARKTNKMTVALKQHQFSRTNTMKSSMNYEKLILLLT